ncbi:CAMK family protein kinase [Tritrichomonas foetus]|uniref:CAMK family protein kinase n=1 Tax=Tritrichomonas foetus TaxID=1144522 RepID=A0A1J4L2B6_9EUKA|nr:CAMK family protein kinase [Tritrichomonas foetus]|eukprot:OHT16100.1 CAMK family protein kinase [Tritrichomonas foetus]
MSSLPDPGHDLEFLCKIAEGQSASVYRVYNNKYQLHYAAKVIQIPPDREKDILAQYNNEVQALHAINHPNVVRLYNFFREESNFYLVFEDCSGGNLEILLELGQNISMPQLQTAAFQIVQAVDACHRANYAHCNINPSNILFDSHDRPKLCDFRSAVTPMNQMVSFTAQKSLYYIAPEEFMKKPYDPSKADIWALGITLYYMASGTYPWSGTQESELLSNIQNHPISYPSSIPQDLQLSIGRMLRVDPSKRPTTEHILRDQFFLNAAKTITSQATTSRRLSKQPNLTTLSKLKGSIADSGNRMRRKSGGQSLVMKFPKNILD